MPLRSTTGHESVTVADTAIGFDATAANNHGVRPAAAVITVETASIRYTVDGTTPTTTVGHLAEPGDVIYITDMAQCSRFLAIRETGVSATIKVTRAEGWIA